MVEVEQSTVSYNHPFSIQKQASFNRNQIFSKQLSVSDFDGQQKVTGKSLTHKRIHENAHYVNATKEKNGSGVAMSGKRLPKFVGGSSRFGLGPQRG
jgi:hypothetical protein